MHVPNTTFPHAKFALKRAVYSNWQCILGTYNIQKSSPDAKFALHLPLASCTNAKFARAPAPWGMSKRKICTCRRTMPHFQTQNLHVYTSHPACPRAKFARSREPNNANHRAICTTTFATAFVWTLFHFRTQNLHVDMPQASVPNAKFARARNVILISKRKICTCTWAVVVQPQNLHVHVAS